MNLQENIQRIKEAMKINPDSQLKIEIEKVFKQLKVEYKDYLDNSKKILDPYVIIDKYKEYLISRTPEIISQLKLGQGGEKFSYDCFLFVKNLVVSELKNMNTIKKLAIRTIAGNKDKLRQEMNEKDISDYLMIFKSIIDFPFMIGYMDEIKSYEDNLWKWEKQSNGWVEKNEKTIKTDIVNTIINNLYS